MTQNEPKIAVGVLGATGSVGCKLVEMLSKHPWFTITALAASEQSVGQCYGDVVTGEDLPKEILQRRIEACEPNLPCQLVFSALDAHVAGDIEEAFARKGYVVVSNAKNHRLRDDVPLVIPEVNSDHLQLVKQQPYDAGMIVTNPNCVVVGLTLALKPLVDAFGVQSVHVVTMQAISGAGYPGMSAIDITDNVIPYICGEEEKIENEPKKILGTLKGDTIFPADMVISAQSNRVPVSDGHLVCVSVKLKTTATEEHIIEAWNTFSGVPQQLQLPTAPHQPIRYLHGPSPQPRRHRNIGEGMTVCVGQLRPCAIFDVKFTLLSHNTIRGAAGSAILNAECGVRLDILTFDLQSNVKMSSLTPQVSS